MWFVIHTKPREEFRALENLEKQGFDAYLPILKREKIVKGVISIKAEPLFGRYLFVSLASQNQNFSVIKSTKGVHGLVTFGQNPSKVHNELIDAIKNLEETQHLKLFEVGDQVRIIDGPLAGINGIFKQQSGEQRGHILIDFLNKHHLVTLNLSSLKPDNH